MVRVLANLACSIAVAVSVILAPNVSFGVAYPDIVTISQTTVTRWNLGTGGWVYSRYTGHRTFGDMTRANDGSCLAYRTGYSGATPALFEIDLSTGASKLVVESSAGASKVRAVT